MPYDWRSSLLNDATTAACRVVESYKILQLTPAFPTGPYVPYRQRSVECELGFRGRMNPRFAVARPGGCRTWHAFWKKPIRCVARTAVARRCSEYDRWESNITPRSFSREHSATAVPLNWMGGVSQGLRWRDTVMACDFVGSKVTRQ